MHTSPIAADRRTKEDTLVPAMKAGHGIYSAHLLETIDWCLSLDHLKRPQSVLTLQKSLCEKIRVKAKMKSLLAVVRDKINGRKA